MEEVCIHCGEALLGTAHVDALGKKFCCGGCRMVYAILNAEEYNQYQCLLDASKKTAPRARIRKSYGEFLEHLAEGDSLHKLGCWKGELHIVDFRSDELSCAACSWLVEKLFSETAGVRFCRVDFMRAQVHLEYDAVNMNLPEVLAKIASFGYHLEPVEEDLAGASTPEQRKVWLRMGIAGALAANVMMFSLGPHFGSFSGISGDWLQFFGWTGFLLSIPSVSWCAWPFYFRAWQGLRVRTIHMDFPVSFGILFTWGVSVWFLLQGESGYFDSVTSLIFFLLLGRFLVTRFERGLAWDFGWYEKLVPGTLHVENDSGELVIQKFGKLQLGSRVRLFRGDFLPVDATLCSESGRFDNSFLTGESRPVLRRRGEYLHAGCRLLDDFSKVEICELPVESRIHRLRESFRKLAENKRGQQSVPERIVPWFTALVLFSAGGALFFNWQHGVGAACFAAASVLVVSCPCALALARPVSRGVALSRLAKRGLHLASEEVLISLGKVRAALLDKTGTLAFSRRKLLAWTWLEDDDASRSELLVRLFVASGRSLHPVSSTVRDHLEGEAAKIDCGIMKFEEFPHFGWICHFADDKHPLLFFRAAVLGKAKSIPESLQGILAGLSIPEGKTADSVVVYGGKLVALLGFEDELRPGVTQMVKELESRGLDVAVLSGDSAERVESFCQFAGISSWHASLSPEKKLNELKKVQDCGKPVLALGDGFNDALLLAAADVGIVTEGGLEALAESADGRFSGSDFLGISSALHLARRLPLAEGSAYALSILYNIVAVTLAFQGLITPVAAAILMPLSSISVCLLAWGIVRLSDRQTR